MKRQAPTPRSQERDQVGKEPGCRKRGTGPPAEVARKGPEWGRGRLEDDWDLAEVARKGRRWGGASRGSS